MGLRSTEDDFATASTDGAADRGDDVLERWSALSQASSAIDPELYVTHDVKRGLRDLQGHGVVAGLTRIGDVVGSRCPEGGETSVPCPGELIYRGIEITDLVNGFVAEQRLGFEETCYLLLFGDLPDKQELDLFESRLSRQRTLPRGFVHDAILQMPSPNVMNALSRGVLCLYGLDPAPEDTSIPSVLRQSLHLISAFPALAVYSYHAHVHSFHRQSLVIHTPSPELSTAENILHLLRSDSHYTPLEAQVLDLTLVLQAEHGGGNNSTFTTHVVSSTYTDTYATIAAALGSLKGPRHGGANLKVVEMFEDIKTEISDWNDEEQIEAYLGRVLGKEAFDKTGLIYGMGHAVYSVSDPRTVILREWARRLAHEKGLAEEFDLYERVERVAPEAIGKRRKLYKGVSANVDFYTGFVYQMLGVPSELYTPLFAVSRIVGWCAHRIEELATGSKIMRPAYKGVAPQRDYVPLEER